MVDFVSLFTGMSERDIGFLLRSLVQDSINSELTNSEISEIDEKTPVLITNSKDVELINDISIQSAVNIEPSTVYLMPEEPDGNNLKIWLKFQNAGEMRDYSYQKNKSYSTGANTMPGLFSKHNENSMMKYELYSYFNGLTHYAYTLDAPPVRIQPIIAANKTASFFIREIPVSLAKALYADNNAIFTKIDDDQIRYGYSVTIDSKGNVNFYIRNNYAQYHLLIKNAYNYLLTDPLYQPLSNFRFENFMKKNYKTGVKYLCGLVDAEIPFDDWFFKYNPLGHNMTAIRTTENNSATILASTSLITEPPYISYALQEGKWTHLGTVQTTIYDNSGHNINGTLTGYTTGGLWNDDNTLTSTGPLSTGGLSIDLPAVSLLNTLTEFSISFWFNPLTEVINNKGYNTVLFYKGYQVANSIYIERTTGVNDLKFAFRAADNVEKSVTFTNPFPTPNKWYMITAKWKSGEKLKLFVNDVEVQGASNVTATLSTAGNNIKLYNATKAPIGIMALFKMWNIQISSTTTQPDLYYNGYHNPLFPKSENIQPVVQPIPDPISIPFTNVYTLDKMPTPVAADYRKINSLAGDNPFIERYSVVDGTDTTDPEVLTYSIADGVTTGGNPLPFTRVGSAPATLDSSDNSRGALGAGQNDIVALEITSTSSGLGQTINGKVITKAIFWMRRPTTSVVGTLNCKIWNAAGTAVATIGTMQASAVAEGSSGSDWQPYTFTNTANTVAMASGFRIGIEYSGYGGDDNVDVQRKGSGTTSSPFDTVIQASYDGSWNTNSSFDIKCDLYTGGTGSAAVDPWAIIKSGSGNISVCEGIGTGDQLIGKSPGKITLRLRKSGSPTGLASVILWNNDGSNKAVFTSTFDVSSLTTSFADYTFTNYIHGKTVALLDKIGILWLASASGEVHVMTNSGNNTGSNTWNGTNSSVFKNTGTAWTASGTTTLDLAGKIYTGGNNFDAYLRFTTTRTRVAIKAVNSSSSLHNKKITKVVVRLRKTGTPSGIINCYIRDAADNIKVTFSSVDVDVIDTSYADVEFTNVVHNYLINSATGSGDKITIEYNNASVSNYIDINSNKDVINTLNTIAQTYDSGNYVDQSQRDIAGKLYEGGEPDLNSRTRVVQSIEHQNSILKGKKITRVKAFLYRTTVGTSGTAYCNIRRGTTDALIKTLGTVPVSSLNTTIDTPSEITFLDTTNNYPLAVGDKISIEFNGGNSTDQLGVLVREVTPNYDSSNSFMRKYDEVDYDDSEPTKDLCATMDEGGFLFYPDPGSIPDPTPVNIKDLLYCAGNNSKSGFFEAFLMEFRIYSKDITLQNADNLYDNRYSISTIGPGQILMPFSLKSNTLDPV